MHIQALRLSVSEDDINGLLEQHLGATAPVEGLRVRLTPEGVVVEGSYLALFMRVSFETLWELTPAGSEVRARLTSVNVAGLPAGILRGKLLRALRDAAAYHPAVQVGDEVVRVDVAQLLHGKGLPVRVHFTALRCGPGTLTVEAGP
jgi:hypothetical protein